jgi:hypothetical protein
MLAASCVTHVNRIENVIMLILVRFKMFAAVIFLMTMSWVKTSCRFVGRSNVSEKRTVSIFRIEDHFSPEKIVTGAGYVRG